MSDAPHFDTASKHSDGAGKSTHWRPMRIVLAIRRINGIVGGAEKAILSCAEGLYSLGHHVTIIIHDPKPGEPFYKVPENIGFVNLAPTKTRSEKDASAPLQETHAKKKRSKHSRIRDARRMLLHRIPLLNELRFSLVNRKEIASIRKFIRGHSPDIIVGFMPKIATMCQMASGNRCPVICSLRNDPERDFGRYVDDASLLSDTGVFMSVLPKYSAITVFFDEFARTLDKAARNNTLVIPNEVAPSNIPLPQQRDRDKKIIFVGRLVNIKRPELLIQAWALIASKYPEWSVEFYGDGSKLNEFRHSMKDKGLDATVSFLGATKNISEIYARSAILCAPSRLEGFPRSVTEAMAHGMAVVGMDDCVSMRELLSPTNTGILVDHRHGAEGLSEALSQLIESADLRDQIGLGARKFVERFAPDKVFALWETHLLDTLAKWRHSHPPSRA